jgi:hypothetical protein
MLTTLKEILGHAREDPLPPAIFGQIKQGVCSMVADKIHLLFAENQAWTPGADA